MGGEEKFHTIPRTNMEIVEMLIGHLKQPCSNPAKPSENFGPMWLKIAEDHLARFKEEKDVQAVETLSLIHI